MPSDSFLTPLFSRFFLFSFLLLWTAAVCSAARAQNYGFNDDDLPNTGPLPIVLTKEIPKYEKEAQRVADAVADSKNEWAPIRIKTFYTMGKEKDITCSVQHHFSRNIFGDTVPCVSRKALHLYTENTGKQILQRAIKLHTERLSVRPVMGNIIVPSFDSENFCAKLFIPEKHHSTGVTGADLTLYAAVSPFHNKKQIAMAASCAAHTDGRPLVGGIILNPLYAAPDRFAVRFAAHEIAHALGFSYFAMKVKNMTKTLSDVRGSAAVEVVKSKNTVKAARSHFGCDALEGMELEIGPNDKKRPYSQTVSHWKRRNAKDELMATPVFNKDQTFIGLYSALTLAAFEDLGYYKADYAKAEYMRWGQKAGCDFMRYACGDSDEQKFPEMFCTEKSSGRHICASNRLGLGRCPNYNTQPKKYKSEGRDNTFTAFSAWTLQQHGDVDNYMMEHCPAVQPKIRCDDKHGDVASYPENAYGRHSWCLDADSVKVKNEDETVTLHGACVEVRCDEGEALRVKYRGAKEFVPCPEGTFIKPNSHHFKGGKIFCPNRAEVCTVDSMGKSNVTSYPANSNSEDDDNNNNEYISERNW